MLSESLTNLDSVPFPQIKERLRGHFEEAVASSIRSRKKYGIKKISAEMVSHDHLILRIWEYLALESDCKSFIFAVFFIIKPPHTIPTYVLVYIPIRRSRFLLQTLRITLRIT